MTMDRRNTLTAQVALCVPLALDNLTSAAQLIRDNEPEDALQNKWMHSVVAFRLLAGGLEPSLARYRPRHRVHLCSTPPQLSNKMIQKGLACRRHWSGTVTGSGRQWHSEILPRQLHSQGGASVVRLDAAMNRTEDLDVEIYGATTSCIIRSTSTVRDATDRGRAQG